MGTRLVIGAVDPDGAREQARDILGGRRYGETEVPRPLAGPLEWLGERLGPLRDAWDAIADWALRGPLAARLVALAVMVAVVVYVAHRVAHARVGRLGDTRRRPSRGLGEPLDVDRLERLAARAERDGDLDAALRLRFRAGLLRLDEVGLIEFRPSITSGEVSRTLRLAPFDRLAGRHDEIVYGGRPATLDDIDDVRTTFPALARTGP